MLNEMIWKNNYSIFEYFFHTCIDQLGYVYMVNVLLLLLTYIRCKNKMLRIVQYNSDEHILICFRLKCPFQIMVKSSDRKKLCHLIKWHKFVTFKVILVTTFNQIYVLIFAVEAKKRRVADGKLKAESAMAAAATLFTNGGIMKKL